MAATFEHCRFYEWISISTTPQVKPVIAKGRKGVTWSLDSPGLKRNKSFSLLPTQTLPRSTACSVVRYRSRNATGASSGCRRPSARTARPDCVVIQTRPSCSARSVMRSSGRLPGTTRSPGAVPGWRAAVTECRPAIAIRFSRELRCRRRIALEYRAEFRNNGSRRSLMRPTVGLIRL